MLSELAGVDDSEEIHSECTEDCFLGLYRGGWFRMQCALGLCSGVWSWGLIHRSVVLCGVIR
ncbi:hypothetical protein HYC85_017943 [Camellia sinensis]|uniref:Uncharacterized protein n=1 Tax=Camellia sinensis TaxID=4442 RepID=A0A7J7GWJ0_CAMSI|nr:hypothetical protein HYC85_017943 [Camellia sinensis]